MSSANLPTANENSVKYKEGSLHTTDCPQNDQEQLRGPWNELGLTRTPLEHSGCEGATGGAHSYPNESAECGRYHGHLVAMVGILHRQDGTHEQAHEAPHNGTFFHFFPPHKIRNIQIIQMNYEVVKLASFP